MPTITIRIKRHLKEFLLSRLQEPPSSSLRTMIGATIIPFIEPLPRGVVPCIGTGDDFVEIDLVYLNSRFNTDIRGARYISEQNQEHINRILEAHFEDLFFQYMDDKLRYDLLIEGKRRNKGQLKLVILQFCSENKIPFNHLNYEMLKKKYYRRLKKELPSQSRNVFRSSLLFLI